MRTLLGLTGALGFVFGCYAFFAADNVMGQIVGMLGFLVAMTGLGAVGIIQAIEKSRADQVELTEIAVTAARERSAQTPAPVQSVAVEQMHPIARARGRAPTDPGGDGSGSSV